MSGGGCVCAREYMARPAKGMPAAGRQDTIISPRIFVDVILGREWLPAGFGPHRSRHFLACCEAASHKLEGSVGEIQ